ncbi:MAG: hypothetical protein LAO03_17005 [Acidobacteriia bacterium]|nr:hypothetical protein [Terriglobia bacterium]
MHDPVSDLGRVCILRDHRSTNVLYLLWRAHFFKP